MGGVVQNNILLDEDDDEVEAGYNNEKGDKEETKSAL